MVQGLSWEKFDLEKDDRFPDFVHHRMYVGYGMSDLMKTVVFLLICFSALHIAAFAQSGRRIQPTPTPIAKTEESSGDYSESITQKTRNRLPRPDFRSVGGKNDSSDDATTASTEGVSAAEDEVVKVETNLITIPVSVYDRNGLYVPNLMQKDFKIYEDGKEQEIAYFGTSDKPFTVVLLLDTSPSTEYKIEEIRRAATAFVDQLKLQDNVLVVEFDRDVHVLTDVTNDRQQIYKAINKANFGEGTSLYDAVDFALRKKLSKIEGRKAIVLFTDGVDTASTRKSYDETIDEAEESEALVFPIYYNTFFDNAGGLGGINGGVLPTGNRGNNPRGTRPQDYALGRQYLNDLAAYTGGRVFRPEATPGGLTAAFEGIAEELRRQYNIGYIPKDEGKSGQRKQIRVRVSRPNLVVRNRDSYIVGTTAKGQAVPASKPN